MYTAKVMLLGDMGVGKTSIMHRLVHDRFDGEYMTTLGVEILSYDVAAGGNQPTRLVLWDTDGDFGARIFETVYVVGASAAIIVSDVTRPQTVTHMVELAHGFESNFPGRPYRALVNKVDLAEGEACAELLGDLAPSAIKFVSAKTGAGIAEAFAELAATVRRRQL